VIPGTTDSGLLQDSYGGAELTDVDRLTICPATIVGSVYVGNARPSD